MNGNITQVKLLRGLNGYIWRKAVFDVPLSISDERVMANATKYRNKVGGILELQGFTVVAVRGPEREKQPDVPVDEDKKRYAIWCYCKRRPQTIICRDVPDELVPELLQYKGTKLLD